jgi:signal transduction histidine kinase
VRDSATAGALKSYHLCRGAHQVGTPQQQGPGFARKCRSAEKVAKRITIDASLSAAQTVGDRVLLERLVNNLLDNAARYNVAGGWIRVATGSQPGGVCLTVANSGREVPGDRVPELFEPFRRLHDRVGTGPGNGLGLSIVQSVVAAHGGELAAHPLPGGGLEVQVGLPGADG